MEISGLLTAMVTPMLSSLDIDLSRLASYINWQVKYGVQGLVVGGTTGESQSLNLDELRLLTEYTLRVVDNRVPVIVGTGAISTSETILKTSLAKKSGAHAALIVTPFYVKPTQEGLLRHFTIIADAVDIPIILYNVPSRTGVDMGPEVILELAKIPNIIGIKEASLDKSKWQEILKQTDDFLLFSGDDSTCHEMMKQGGHGVISVASNIIPELMTAMVSKALTGSPDADTIQNYLSSLNEFLFCETNPIPIKWMLYKKGVIDRGIRMPLHELSDKFQKKLDNLFDEYQLNENIVCLENL